jgi:hypothetical protein
VDKAIKYVEVGHSQVIVKSQNGMSDLLDGKA